MPVSLKIQCQIAEMFCHQFLRRYVVVESPEVTSLIITNVENFSVDAFNTSLLEQLLFLWILLSFSGA